MTRRESQLEARLGDLLKASTSELPPVDFAVVARKRQTRHRTTIAVALVLAAAGCIATLAAASTFNGETSTDTLGQAPVTTSTSDSKSVSYQGIEIRLPSGWRVAPPTCGSPENNTLTLGENAALRCPHSPSLATTALRVESIYGPEFALGWHGVRSEWHGQPAWLQTETAGRIATTTLTLPWLNVTVVAQSTDRIKAQQLLDQISPAPLPGLAVPDDASDVLLQSLAGHDGQGQPKSIVISNANDVHTLLRDLRELPPIQSAALACDSTWSPRTMLLTVRAQGRQRTYAARFDECPQVVAGTGSAAETTSRLLDDLQRLFPNSGF